MAPGIKYGTSNISRIKDAMLIPVIFNAFFNLVGIKMCVLQRYILFIISLMNEYSLIFD